jgi:hypothetical protein
VSQNYYKKTCQNSPLFSQAALHAIYGSIENGTGLSANRL